jgi:hypothetical protein
VPPKPGIKPKLISGKEKTDFYEAKIISQRSATSNPPPKALPLTAAMTGFLFLLKASASICNG